MPHQEINIFIGKGREKHHADDPIGNRRHEFE
ncbi:hypothetical protein SAMN05880570_0309 [Paenibacillus sp. RU4T]|nr:hypothetical protein SAMN05880555_0309 [Paenibacillus sp. RU4X]SIQ20394.1 hypothetical protein SAMN05880570_0309 [Paenibacillus sp. RU4T]